MSRLGDLRTPALVVDGPAFERNVARMAEWHPGEALRPHVKAFKSTALARELRAAGHRGFCAATLREVEGMVAAGLGDDLLLANEVLDHRRLTPLVEAGARITVAVDGEEVLDSAVAAGVREVLVDVNVGMPRCGCRPADAARLAERARAAGLAVRGVMGYEGHLMMADEAEKEAAVGAAMAPLLEAHREVGGEVVSGGGTGTAHLNRWVTEVQAGSYTLMDTDYATLGLPFELALSVLGEVVSVDPEAGRYAVADVGLKALAMDHGPPAVPGAAVWFVSDEHVTFDAAGAAVGDRIRLRPAHVDPTVAKHEVLHVVDGDEVVERWPVDLRGW